MGRVREIQRLRRRVRIGAPDSSLTPVSGMAAVTELVDRLDMVGLLDAAIGQIKARNRGHTAGELLVGMAAAQLAGEEFLVGLDRHRADVAGQQIVPVAGLSFTTAAGLAQRLSDGQWQAVQTGVGDIHTAMLAALPPARAAALCEEVTVDLDTTDVVYGRKKRGVAYNYQGQRVGRPHVATWAKTATVLAAGLMGGDEDPRRHAPELLGPALGALSAAARAGRVRMRADAGYFAGQLARAAHFAGVQFAIGAKRIAPLWPILGGVAEGEWTDALDMDRAQVAVADYCPHWWPAATRLLTPPGAPGPRAAQRRSPVAAPPYPAPRPARPADQRAHRARRGVWLLVHPHQPGRVHTRAGRRRAALLPPPDSGRECPGRPARCRAWSSPVGIPAGQHRVDGGCVARDQHRRLVAPAHRHPRTRRAATRPRHPRGPSHGSPPWGTS